MSPPYELIKDKDVLVDIIHRLETENASLKKEKRNYFAGQAIAGLMSVVTINARTLSFEKRARIAYEQADAMMKAMED